MKQVSISFYKFNELSEEAQRKALDNFEPFTAYIWDDAKNTAEKFADEFYVETGYRCWLDYSSNSFDDPINELSGIRLRTWLLNNYGHLFTEGKPYGEYKKRGNKWEYTRRSKVIFQPTCCPLTGVCYDEDILQPVREFINKPDNRTLPDLLNECFETLRISLEREEEYRYSDKGKRKDIEANDYEFTEYGERY